MRATASTPRLQGGARQKELLRPAVAHARPATSCDPFLPILHDRNRGKLLRSDLRYDQSIRRSHILSTIRRLLAERGLRGVTVRRVAEASGHAIQTIYNLVGPLDQAIIDAISEFTRSVSQAEDIRPEDPNAVLKMADYWLDTVEAYPELCREVSLILHSKYRNLYYDLRDRQSNIHGLLKLQQRCGVIRRDAPIRQIADQMVLFMGALCMEWSDRGLSIEDIRQRVHVGLAGMLADALEPDIRGVSASERT
jgi:AcrR family transcriptional regulator